MVNFRRLIKKYWQHLAYDPRDIYVGPQIVVIGGGTGLAVLLSGLKKYSQNLTAIVTMCDTGGSTGRLQKDFDILPPGDIRQCLIALSGAENLLRSLFEYRFTQGELAGHSFGNLFITALVKVTGSFEKAIEEASRLLATHGQVLPSTLEKVVLCARFKNGEIVRGEANIPLVAHQNPIQEIFLEPEDVKPYFKAIEAIAKADLIIIGPGSLYTSIIPNLLIKDLTKAILNASVPKVYICNVSTERGETENYDVEKHLEILKKYSHPNIVNFCVVNTKILRRDESDELGAIYNISTEKESIGDCKIIGADVISENQPLFHDSDKLAKVIKEKFLDTLKK